MKDSALCPLTNMGTLRYLSLRSVSFTDASLHQFSSAAKLIHLGFRDAVLTDNGLNAFFPPAALEVLNLRGCWLLTEDALLHFCYKHPQIEVRHEIIETLDKGIFNYSSPSKVAAKSSQWKHKQGKLSLSPLGSEDIFLGKLS